MRIRFIVGRVTAGLVGCGLALQACSGGGADDTHPADGGPEAPDASVGQRGVSDPGDAEAACDPRGDLFTEVRDASIGDGASTTGVCLACAKTHCDDAIAKCTQNCPCQNIVSGAIECYLTTQQIGCAAALANIFVTSETRSDALSLLGCVRSECPAECVIDGGAAPDPGDSGSDAP